MPREASASGLGLDPPRPAPGPLPIEFPVSAPALCWLVGALQLGCPADNPQFHGVLGSYSGRSSDSDVSSGAGHDLPTKDTGASDAHPDQTDDSADSGDGSTTSGPTSQTHGIDGDASSQGTEGSGTELDGSGTSTGGNSTSGTEPCEWIARRPVNFENVGSQVDLRDVPIMVALDTERIDYNIAIAGGQGLRFLDESSQSVYDYEIDTWTFEGVSIIWLEYPRLRSSTEVWMYFGWRSGHNSLTPGENADGTWSSNYRAVWHMNERNPLDASGSSHPARGTSALFAIEGQVAGAQRFANSSARLDIDLGPYDDFSFSAWIRPDAPQARSTLVGSLMGPSFILGGLDAGADRLALLLDGHPTARSSRPLARDTWSHVVLTRRGSELRFFIDGQAAGTASFSETIDLDVVGHDGRDNGAFIGDIDELHIAQTAHSSDWIDIQYRSMADRLLTFGGTEAVTNSCPILMDTLQ